MRMGGGAYRGDGDQHRVHANSSVSGGVRVEQSSLHRDDLCAERGLVVGEVQGEGAVGGTVGQGEEVSAADEVISVEIGESQATSSSDAHHRLEGSGSGQVVGQFLLELVAVARAVEARVVVGGATAVLGERGDGGEVSVLRGEEESVHTDLQSTEVDGVGLVPRILGVE